MFKQPGHALPSKQTRRGWDQLLTPPHHPMAGLKSTYRIIIRSFIAAPTVGFGPSTFFGDARKPTAEVNSTTHFRAIQEFDVSINRGSARLHINRQQSSATIGIISLPSQSITVPIIVVDYANTQHFPSIVRRTRNSVGRITNSFHTSYWAKDPVTPQLFTPALDVHAEFAITAYEDLGVLRVALKLTGDVFPSVEVIMVNPTLGRENILLGTHMEKGGLPDLFLDNRHRLFEADVDLVLDKNGSFTDVRKAGRTYPIRYWNQEVIRKAYQNKS